MERLFDEVEVTDETYTLTSGHIVPLVEMKRCALSAQIDENMYWSNLPVVEESRPRPSPAGYLPKQKPLMYRLDYHEMAKRRMDEEIDLSELQSISKDVIEYIELQGRMKECDDWLRVQDEHGDWGTLVVGKEGREAKMPIFGSRADVDEHIKNRHLGMGFMDEETVKRERKKVYRGIANAHAQAVSRDNAESKREV